MLSLLYTESSHFNVVVKTSKFNCFYIDHQATIRKWQIFRKKLNALEQFKKGFSFFRSANNQFFDRIYARIV